MNLIWTLAVILLLLFKNQEVFCSTDDQQSLQNNKNQECSIPASCTNTTSTKNSPGLKCFGQQLPYDSVSFVFTKFQSFYEIQEEIGRFKPLKFVPECWKKLAPLLCSVAYPKCEDNHVEKINYQLCYAMERSCPKEIVLDWIGKWPGILNCKNSTVFTTTSTNFACRSNDHDRQRFNSSEFQGSCLKPYLLNTSDSTHGYYEGILGCAKNCKDPRYSSDDHNSLYRWNNGIFGITLLFSLMYLLASIIEWKNGMEINLIFQLQCFMKFCCVLYSIGMLIPMTSDEAFCQEDGTERVGIDPISQCGIVFLLVYLPSIMFDFCMVIMTLKLLGCKIFDKLEKGMGFVWLLISVFLIALFFTVFIFTRKGVDGYSLSGICHVSFYDDKRLPDHKNILIAVIVPKAMIALLTTIFHFIFEVNHLEFFKKESSKNKSYYRYYRSFICIFIICNWIIVGLFIYLITNISWWDESFKKYLICQAKKYTSDDNLRQCSDLQKPDWFIFLCLKICSCLPGLLLCLLLNDFRKFRGTWKDFMQRWFHKIVVRCLAGDENYPLNEMKLKEKPLRNKKHEVIKKAYEYSKRPEYQDGRLSLTLNDKDENSIIPKIDRIDQENPSVVEDICPTFLEALPRLVMRRGAISGLDKIELKRTASFRSFASRRSASNLSLSRSYSIQQNRYSWAKDRRRNSICSIKTLQQSELDDLRKIQSSSRYSDKVLSRRKRFLNKFSGFRRSISSRQSSFSGFSSNDKSFDASSLQSVPATLDVRQLPNITGSLHDSKLDAALANVSKTSKETLLTDSRNINVVSIIVPAAHAGTETIGTQTSLTDLSNLSKKPEVHDVKIQCNIPISFPSTTSSSQTEEKSLLRNANPIEPHVIQTRHHDTSSGESSSIPSSYDRDRNLRNINNRLQQEAPMKTFEEMRRDATEQPNTHRTRRNAVVVVDQHDQELEIKSCSNYVKI